MSDPMADIMEADDAVDALDDLAVKDCFVRAKLMRGMMEHHSNRPGGFCDDGFKEAENALCHFDMDGVRCWALKGARKRVLSEKVERAAVDNRAEDFVIEVADVFVPDDWDDDRAVAAMRGWLKKHLRGSLGMPDDRVIRERLKAWGDA